jgi:hypothetical protein
MDALCDLEGLVPARAWGFKSPLRHRIHDVPADLLPSPTFVQNWPDSVPILHKSQMLGGTHLFHP